MCINNWIDCNTTAGGWTYQSLLLVLVQLCSVARGVAHAIFLFAATLAIEEYKEGKNQLLWIHSAFTAGSALGSYEFGFIADRYGRKLSMSVALATIIFSALSTSTSISFTMCIASLLFLASGIIGNEVASKVLVGEQGFPYHRGFSIASMDRCFYISFILTFVACWLWVSNGPNMYHNSLRVLSWRVMFLFAALVAAILFPFPMAILPPSPRHLLYIGKIPLAENVCRWMFALNTGQLVHYYENPVMQFCVQPRGPNETSTSICSLLGFTAVVRLFQPPYWKLTILLSGLRVLLLPGACFAVVWLSQLISQSNFSCVLKEVTILNITCKLNQTCSHQFNPDANIFVIAIAPIVSMTVLVHTAHLMGRKLAFGLPCAVISTCCVVLLLLNPLLKTIQCVVAFSAVGSSAMAHSVLDITQIENYPTSMRGLSLGLTRVPAFILLFVILHGIHLNCNATLFIVSIFHAVAVLLSIFLPDISKEPMIE